MIYIDNYLIESEFKKYNFVKKILKQWNQKENILRYEFYHFKECFLFFKESFKNISIKIEKYKNFQECYNFIKKISYENLDNAYHLFYLKTKDEVDALLHFNNFEFFYLSKDTIKIKINSLEDLNKLNIYKAKKLRNNLKKYLKKYTVFIGINLESHSIDYSLNNHHGQSIFTLNGKIISELNRSNLFLTYQYNILFFIFLFTSSLTSLLFIKEHLDILNFLNQHIRFYLFFNIIYTGVFSFSLISILKQIINIRAHENIFCFKSILLIFLLVFTSASTNYLYNYKALSIALQAITEYDFYNQIKTINNKKQEIQLLKNNGWHQINKKYYFKANYLVPLFYNQFGCEGKHFIYKQVCFYKVE